MPVFQGGLESEEIQTLVVKDGTLEMSSSDSGGTHAFDLGRELA